MPKLHGYRIRRPFDVYDSFSPRLQAKAPTNALCLFGRTNIGVGYLSNVQVPNLLNGNDRTSVICNWYARTNIPMPPAFGHPSYAPPADLRPTPLEEALAEFAQMTVVTMTVGDHPMAELPLAQLLRRRHGDRSLNKETQELPTVRSGDLAAGMYEDYRLAGGTGRRWDELPEHAELGMPGETGRAPWIAAARHAVQVLEEPVVTIVPVRQSCGAHIQFETKSLGKLNEMLIENRIAPRPLVWIHFDGFDVRDVG